MKNKFKLQYSIIAVLVIALLIFFILIDALTDKVKDENIKKDLIEVTTNMELLQSRIEEMESYVKEIDANYVLVSKKSETFDKLESGRYTVPRQVYFSLKYIGDLSYQQKIIDGFIRDSVSLNEEADYLEFNDDDIKNIDIDGSLEMNSLYEIRDNTSANIDTVLSMLE